MATRGQAANFVRSDDEMFRSDIFMAGSAPGTRPVIFSNEHFRVVPTLGPLHPLHLLICSNREVTGLQEMGDAEVEGLERLVANVERIFWHSFARNFVMFENGTADGGQSACSIRHFHMHVVPTLREPDRLLHTEIDFESVENLKAAARRAAQYGDYQLLKLPGRNPSIRRRGMMPSQYLRRRVAEINGMTEWDWRKYEPRNNWSEVAANCIDIQAALVRSISTDEAH